MNGCPHCLLGRYANETAAVGVEDIVGAIDCELIRNPKPHAHTLFSARTSTVRLFVHISSRDTDTGYLYHASHIYTHIKLLP